MAETATPAVPPTAPTAPSERVESAADRAADRAHTARMMLVVVGLAAGFALVPRATQSCGKASGTEDAADFTATVVANPLEPGQKTLDMGKLRGHPVVLDFWATWCGPCQAEAPIVNALSQRFKDKGLVVIGVNTSDAEGLAAMYAAKKGLTFPIVYDEGNAIANKYRVDNLPTLFVVSKDGKIIAERHGVTSDADLERLVRQVL
jgi:cytochrome c biogenesis protein CcmG/thiol:disulfide interchange protein DsbE